MQDSEDCEGEEEGEKVDCDDEGGDSQAQA